MDYEKVYVNVIAEFASEGGVKPLLIRWEDGHNYEINKIIKIDNAAAHVGSVLPLRYYCKIGNNMRYLYYEKKNERFFVEMRREYLT